MIKVQDADQLARRQLRDGSGRLVGQVQAIACSRSDRYAAEWALVRIGLLRRRRRLVSLRQAQLRSDGRIYVPASREQLIAAPAAGMADLRCAGD